MLRGAALHARIVAQLQRHYLDGFRLDWSQYTALVERDGRYEGPYYRGGPTRFLPFPTHTVTFTHRETDAQIVVTNIYTSDAGEITQCGSNFGALTY